MKRNLSFLSILMLMLALSASGVYAQGSDPQQPLPTPLPPRDGAVSGSVSHTIEVTVGEEGVRAEKGKRGLVEETVHRLVADPGRDRDVNWSTRSLLQYYDYGDYEDVQGASDNSTDQQVYMLRVLGELFHNGNRLWNNTVTSYNTTDVSSGYSPWYRGYNAFWESKGSHSMKVTSSSPTQTGNSSVSRQF
jgi:hypothetical protein